MISEQILRPEMERLLHNRSFMILTDERLSKWTATEPLPGISPRTKPAAVFKSLMESLHGPIRVVKYGKKKLLVRDISQEILFTELKRVFLTIFQEHNTEEVITAGKMHEHLSEDDRIRLFLCLGLKREPKSADIAKFCSFSNTEMVFAKRGTDFIITQEVAMHTVAESLKTVFLQILEQSGCSILPRKQVFDQLRDLDKLRLKMLLRLKSVPKETDLGKFCKLYLPGKVIVIAKKGETAIVRRVGSVRAILSILLAKNASFTLKEMDAYQLTASEKSSRAAVLNELMASGCIRVELDATLKVCRIHRIESQKTPEYSPSNLSLTILQNSIDFEEKGTQFRAAYERQVRGGLYARICDMRRDLNWEKPVFDAVLKNLRDRRVIQLQPGDTHHMTQQDVQDSFLAENYALYLNLSWR